MTKINSNPPSVLPAEASGIVSWSAIHRAVQTVLSSMDERVREFYPHVPVSEGSNTARGWFLFTSRVYSSAANSDVDPIVVGINFSPSGAGARIHADIAGETSGDILLELPERHEVDPVSIQEAARDLAHRLAEEAPRVGRALDDPVRRV